VNNGVIHHSYFCCFDLCNDVIYPSYFILIMAYLSCAVNACVPCCCLCALPLLHGCLHAALCCCLLACRAAALEWPAHSSEPSQGRSGTQVKKVPDPRIGLSLHLYVSLC
jgi:hypothetical protein